MALDWDNIIIETDEYSYSLDAEQRMILFAGNKGDKGDKGDAATIQVGTVTTLPAGSPATVQNAGTQNDAIFNFGIPQGQQGVPGSDVWGAITGTLSDQTDLQDALNAKQNTLTFDNTPTDGSNNPVTSDGIYDALAAKQNTLTFDNVPTDGSNNPVKSDGIYDALAGKQNTLTFDDAPTDGSNNPVKSDGIYDALALKAPLASPTFTGTPAAPTASSGTNTTQIATTAYVQGELAKEILYFYQQSVSAANNAQILQITDTSITTNTVLLNITFAAPANITSGISWQSFNGYITFTGTCTAGTTANVTLGQKGN